MKGIFEWIVLIIGVIVITFIAYSDGKELGRIQVASGQYGCALVEQPNKTTKWECDPNQEEQK